MKKQPVYHRFTISPVLPWVLLISGFILTAIAAFAKILHIEIAGVLMPLGLLVQFPVWLIVLRDMAGQQLKHKPMWIMGMLFIPWLVMLLYLLQRERLVRMAAR